MPDARDHREPPLGPAYEVVDEADLRWAMHRLGAGEEAPTRPPAHRPKRRTSAARPREDGPRRPRRR